MLSESTANNKKLLWDTNLILETIEQSFFRQFASKSGMGPVHLKTEFQREGGYKMTIPLAMKLAGEGVDGDDTLEDSEEDLVDYDFPFYIDQKRNAVRLKGNMEEQKTSFKMRSAANNRLAGWLSEIVDKEHFRKLGGVTNYTFGNTPTAPSSTRVIYGGNATSDSDIDSADEFTIDLIEKAKVVATTTSPRIPPIKWKGKSYYICLIHPYQRYSLRNVSNSAWMQAQREAGARGNENPIFSGADGIWDDVVIHTHNFVPTFSNWGSGANLAGARALFLGAQAVAFGIGAAGAGMQTKTFDYGNQYGIANGRIFGTQKTVFNSVDYSTIAIDTYAASPV